MILFHVDLDNTLIYSYRHPIGPKKRTAEIYQGREISFLTERTQELLRKLQPYVQIIPTTTRTAEQYARIELGIGKIPYALVCNGGQLLIDGKSDDTWYRQSIRLVQESQTELETAVQMLEAEKSRTMEVRLLHKLFVFTKCSRPQETAAYLARHLNIQKVDVFQNGEKVYVVPKKLDKGSALARFRKYTGACKVIAAGDSAFDRSMLEQADLAAAPANYEIGRTLAHTVRRMPGKTLFSEEMLEFFLRNCPEITYL